MHVKTTKSKIINKFLLYIQEQPPGANVGYYIERELYMRVIYTIQE